MDTVTTVKTVKLFATLRDLAGTKTLDIPFEDGQTVRELIDSIAEMNGELAREIVNDDGELTGAVHILVHGRHIHWGDGLDTVIRDKDIVVLMPPTAGG